MTVVGVASVLSGASRAEAPLPAAPVVDEAAMLVADLRARILRSDSATAVLEGWCAEHRLSGEARLVALRQKGIDKPLTPEQRARLGVGPDEPIRYRRVRLACGTRVLSEADNWYVPSRLTPAMNAALDDSDVPFGRVVRPLAPVRRVVSVQSFPLLGKPAPETPLVQVDAVLSTGAGMPFCEVVETYLGAALPMVPSPAPASGDAP